MELCVPRIQPNNMNSTLTTYVVQGRNLEVRNDLFYIGRQLSWLERQTVNLDVIRSNRIRSATLPLWGNNKERDVNYYN